MTNTSSGEPVQSPLLSLRLRSVEEILANCALAAMMLLPLLEIVVRPLIAGGIPGSISIVQHLTLWVAFLGAALAAREGKLIALATATFIPAGTVRDLTQIFSAFVSTAVCTILAVGAIDLVLLDKADGTMVTAGVPVWIAQLVLPVSFMLIAVRLAWRSSLAWNGRTVAVSGIALGYWLSQSVFLATVPVWPLILLILVAAVFGAPIFSILGGVAVLSYMGDGALPALVIVQTYSLATQPHLPAILAQGRSSERLLRVFRALVGWIPGGTPIVCVVLCAFFTVFTGGAGVTILALGGLLFPALLKEGYRERFSVGLLTASGSLGLLFPPAMPLILYAIVAQVAPDELFVAGIIPGLLLLLLVGAWGMREGLITGAGRHAFEWVKARAALWDAKWELSLPVVVLGVLFSGWATLVETSAFTALYAAVIAGVIHRDFALVRGLHQAFKECIVLIGGVLIILGVAVGFTAYLVDAEVPLRVVEWSQEHIGSRIWFLLALNVFLLLVGCMMDIFSAIFVVVPLIVPVAEQFGVDPIHLGIIFIANLELGYLTPPVGLNLFLASYRFNRPLLEVYRASLPLLAILGIGVLIITYVPWLTLWLVNWL